MKIGLNMHLWSTHISDAPCSLLGELEAIGYDGFEVFLTNPERSCYEQVGKFRSSIDMKVDFRLGADRLFLQ
jgi:hypothetical protein